VEAVEIMLCTECGHINPSYSDICEKCGKEIPDRTAPPPKLTAHLDKLRRSAEQVKRREMSSGQFRDLLNDLRQTFSDNLQALETMDLPDDIKEEAREELNTGKAGIKLYLEAINEMHRFLDTRETIHLDRGLAMAVDANNRLNEALRMNWKSFRNIQETAEEFLRSQSTI